MADFEKKQPVLDRRHFVGGASLLARSPRSRVAPRVAPRPVVPQPLVAPRAAPCATTSTTRSASSRTTCRRTSTQVGFQLFDSLTQYNFETGELEPLACESWEVNDDATEFTFHLKEAKFHDGTDVLASNWKYGWERIVNPATNPESPSVIGTTSP